MIMITEMEVTHRLHKNNDLYLQNAEELGDYAARFRPGYWIFVGPSSKNIWKNGRKTN